MTDNLNCYAEYRHLLFDRPAPWVLRVTINNPESLNAIGGALSDELVRVWTTVDGDPQTRVAIVTGAGKAFSSGGAYDSIAEEKQLDRLEKFCHGFGGARDMVSAIISMRKPLISAINGPAVGLGLAIALLADIPIAGRTAKLFDGHLRIGVVPGDHAMMIWPLLCGLAKAKFHLMTNTPLTGEEAERMNLVALAVDNDVLQDKALEVARKLADTAPNALRMTKYALNHFLRQNQTVFDLGLAFEMVNFGSDESAEAIRAWRSKENPDFKPAAIDFR